MRRQSPLGRRHPRTASHIESCRDCAAAVHRERQYLERLRDAPIPPASGDLTARLLARTQELAAQQPVPDLHHQRFRPAVRIAALSAGGTMAAAGVLAAGAFAVAGDPLPSPGAPAAADLSQVSSQTPADGRTLSPERLAALRSEGWVCPELEAMGFQLESAKALVFEGRPAVELKLSNGTHYATVTERHTAGPGAGADPAAVGGEELRILSSSPWSATYRASGRTFTYESDLPPEQADDALPILQRLSESAEGVTAEAAQVPRVEGPESLAARLQRGVDKIMALLTQ